MMQVKSALSKETVAGIAVLLVVATGSVAETQRSAVNWGSVGRSVVLPRQEFPSARPSTMPARQSWNSAVAMTRPVPAEICREVKENVAYVPDVRPEDEWRSGRDTFTRGGGDCEDMAASVKDLCAEKGIKSEMYIIGSPVDKKAHAVVIGSDGADMWMSSNGSYQRIASLDDAKERISREMGWWYDQARMEKARPQGGGSFGAPATASRN